MSLKVKHVFSDPDADTVTSRYSISAANGEFTLTKQFYADGPAMFEWELAGPGVLQAFRTKKAALKYLAEREQQHLAIAKQLSDKVVELAHDRAAMWRWDAQHGEVGDPVWALQYASDLEKTTVWAAPDGSIRVRTHGGHYTAYELLENAAAAVLTPDEFNRVDMQFDGDTYGVAVLRLYREGESE